MKKGAKDWTPEMQWYTWVSFLLQNMQLKSNNPSEDEKGWLSQRAEKVVVELSFIYLFKFSSSFQMLNMFSM